MNLIKSQHDLLKLLATGATLKEIAQQSGVKYNTIKTRTKLLYKIFEVNNRKDLIFKTLKLKIILYTDIKPKFRKRFVKSIKRDKIPYLQETLTHKEITYLLLKACGMKGYEIIESMHLASKYHERYIRNLICYKLNARNITHAVTNAIILGII